MEEYSCLEVKESGGEMWEGKMGKGREAEKSFATSTRNSATWIRNRSKREK